MYVCMYVRIEIYVRAAAYSLDCHEGAVINCRLYRTFQSLNVSRTETDIELSRTVSGSEFHSVGPEYEKLRCP